MEWFNSKYQCRHYRIKKIIVHVFYDNNIKMKDLDLKHNFEYTHSSLILKRRNTNKCFQQSHSECDYYNHTCSLEEWGLFIVSLLLQKLSLLIFFGLKNWYLSVYTCTNALSSGDCDIKRDMEALPVTSYILNTSTMTMYDEELNIVFLIYILYLKIVSDAYVFPRLVNLLIVCWVGFDLGKH